MCYLAVHGEVAATVRWILELAPLSGSCSTDQVHVAGLHVKDSSVHGRDNWAAAAAAEQ